MAITVQIPTERRHTAGVSSIAVRRRGTGRTVLRLDEKFDLKPHLPTKPDSAPLPNIYVNEEDIRFLGGRLTLFKKAMKSCWCRDAGGAAVKPRLARTLRLPILTLIICCNEPVPRDGFAALHLFPCDFAATLTAAP